MPGRKHKLNKTTIGLSTSLSDFFRSEIDDIAKEIEAINSTYHKRRNQLVEEHVAKLIREESSVQSYTHGGLSLQMTIQDHKASGFPRATIYWVRGRWKVNTRDNGWKITTTIHHCGTDGNYSNHNLRFALKTKLPAEVKLTITAEKDVQKFREYLNRMSDIHTALSACPSMPALPPGGTLAKD